VTKKNESKEIETLIAYNPSMIAGKGIEHFQSAL
jgi:hypothetical protein